METIHGDELVSSLFISGYNKVDMLYFYPFVKERILTDPSINSLVIFDDYDVCSPQLKKHAKIEDYAWVLNESVPSEKIKPTDNEYEILVGDELPVNKTLVDYILRSDFTDLIIRKVLEIGVENLPANSELFSNKEINIVKKVYGNHVFGELYASDEELDVEDYSKLTDEELILLFNESTYKNYIYKYLLNDHQKQVLDIKIYSQKSKDDIFNSFGESNLEKIRNSCINDSNQYLILNIISARSRNKKRES